VLGWKPTVTFEELIRMMVDSDLSLLSTKVAKTNEPAIAGD
jgi:GDP-D-mannose dehydratase